MSGDPLDTVSGLDVGSSCGRASARPGTQMNAYAMIEASSGWATAKGMICRSSVTDTCTRLAPVTIASFR